MAHAKGKHNWLDTGSAFYCQYPGCKARKAYRVTCSCGAKKIVPKGCKHGSRADEAKKRKGKGW